MLSIGNYKTRKKYGVKRIDIEEKRVVKEMKQWLAVSPNAEYILVNTKDGSPMSSLHITQNLTRIFKKNFDKSVGSTKQEQLDVVVAKSRTKCVHARTGLQTTQYIV